MQTPPRETRDVNTSRESSLPESVENNENIHSNDSDDESNEDTVVVLERSGTTSTNNHNPIVNNINNANNGIGGGVWNADAPLWALGPIDSETQMEERLEIILGKLKDLQMQSCRQFFLLCLVPTILMSVVIWAIIADLGHCGNDDLTTCSRERRTFINAYTSRCICRAIRLNSG